MKKDNLLSVTNSYIPNDVYPLGEKPRNPGTQMNMKYAIGKDMVKMIKLKT